MIVNDVFVQQLLLFAGIGYLLGSIPFGLLLSKSAGLGDIRTTGSGNIGATNVLRTGNKKIAALTLLLDMLKGAFAVTIATIYTEPSIDQLGAISPSPIAFVAGLSALLGHIFPVWLKGNGGKGVATYFGVMLSLSWQVFLISILNWLLFFWARRISSLSALLTALFAPFWLYIFGGFFGGVFGLIYSFFVIFKHSENIKRLIRGHEEPFNTPKAESSDE